VNKSAIVLVRCLPQDISNEILKIGLIQLQFSNEYSSSN